MVSFPTPIPDCDSHSPAFLDLFLSFDTSICFTMASPPLRNSDHVVVSVSIDFPLNSQQDVLFHLIGLSMNILNTGDKLPKQRGFFTNSMGDLLPALGFLAGLYNFCNFGIMFSLM